MTAAPAWTSALDALEEWVRALNGGLRSGGSVPSSPAPELPAGPVPPALAVRALALQCAMVETARAGAEQRLRRDREQAYTTA